MLVEKRVVIWEMPDVVLQGYLSEFCRSYAMVGPMNVYARYVLDLAAVDARRWIWSGSKCWHSSVLKVVFWNPTCDGQTR